MTQPTKPLPTPTDLENYEALNNFVAWLDHYITTEDRHDPPRQALTVEARRTIHFAKRLHARLQHAIQKGT